MTLGQKIIAIAVINIVTIILLVTIKLIYRNYLRRYNKLHVRFTVRILHVLIICACAFSAIDILLDNLSLASVVLKGSALVVAIIGFAAQPVISDLISGYLISINKPFEIGDRIIVEGEAPGVVEDLTLRHTVIRIYDDIRIIVPNSILNSKIITNTSYHHDFYRLHLKFNVSYDTDVQKAANIIRDAVAASPYTLGVSAGNIQEDSGPVYFLEYGDSALILETTILINQSTSSYIATTDINTRVKKAFNEYGIEIPYNYVNVVERSYADNTGKEYRREADKPIRRNYRTNTIALQPSSYMKNIEKLCDRFAEHQNLDSRATYQLQLLSEEMVNLVTGILGKIKVTFYIDGTGLLCRLHLHINAGVDSSSRNMLLELSSNYTSDTNGISGQIWSFIKRNLENKDSRERQWTISDQDVSDISKTLLTKLSDEINVKSSLNAVDITVIKKN